MRRCCEPVSTSSDKAVRDSDSGDIWAVAGCFVVGKVSNPVHITDATLPSIIDGLKAACDADKEYQASITLFDDSLKARQRALANIWYASIGNAKGITTAAAEAFCKYHYGFRIRCENDPDLASIIRKMLDGRTYEAKLIIISTYSEWFPILRSKSGMNTEQLGRYLSEMQRNMGAAGVFLSTPKERELLSYPEANN